MRKRRIWAIILFWVALFFAVGTVGVLSDDGDPSPKTVWLMAISASSQARSSRGSIWS
jgi:hypothetical protein